LSRAMMRDDSLKSSRSFDMAYNMIRSETAGNVKGSKGQRDKLDAEMTKSA
jgi:hypothetical protein